MNEHRADGHWAEAISETEKALLVVIGDENYWIPKSAIHGNSEVFRVGDEGRLVLHSWFAGKLAPVDDQLSITTDGRLAPPIGEGKPIRLTLEQRKQFDAVAEKARDQLAAKGLNRSAPDGRCLEIVCTTFMASLEAPNLKQELLELSQRLHNLEAAIETMLGKDAVAQCLEGYSQRLQHSAEDR
jgi:hypothetical protein